MVCRFTEMCMGPGVDAMAMALCICTNEVAVSKGLSQICHAMWVLTIGF